MKIDKLLHWNLHPTPTLIMVIEGWGKVTPQYIKDQNLFQHLNLKKWYHSVRGSKTLPLTLTTPWCIRLYDMAQSEK